VITGAILTYVCASNECDEYRAGKELCRRHVYSPTNRLQDDVLLLTNKFRVVLKQASRIGCRMAVECEVAETGVEETLWECHGRSFHLSAFVVEVSHTTQH
jgi:hypothetical protein